MNAKCLNCGAALVFDVASRKMKCSYCKSRFRMDDIPMKESGNTMECNVYCCTSCGAEMLVNHVESATYCAYCGQPTVVFSRISQEARPEGIIPFSLSKETAIDLIRERFIKGDFVPQEVKNFEVERVNGIYIPYWVFDLHYSDKQWLEGYTGNGETERIIYFVRGGDCDFVDIYLDASKNLLDRYSQLLEPYDLSALVPFRPHYMCGFHADKFDMESEMLHNLAFHRAKEMFDEKMIQSCRARSVHIIADNPKREIKKASYVLLPAWFMTFRYNNESYTMIVNGQTGKIIGTAPISRSEVLRAAIAPFIAMSLITVSIAIILCGFFRSFVCLFIMYGISSANLYAGRSKLKKFRENRKFTTESTIKLYAHVRQEGKE